METGKRKSSKKRPVFLSAALGTSIGMQVVEALKLGIIACMATIFTALGIANYCMIREMADACVEFMHYA